MPDPVPFPTAIITGRQKTIFIPHPTKPGKRVPYVDKSQMVVTYPHGRHQLLREAGRLASVSAENPGATVEILKPGETPGIEKKKVMPLADWIKEAASKPLPAEARREPPTEAPPGELDDVEFPEPETAAK